MNKCNNHHKRKIDLRTRLEREQLDRVLRREFQKKEPDKPDFRREAETREQIAGELTDDEIYHSIVHNILSNNTLSIDTKFELMISTIPDEAELLAILDEELYYHLIEQEEYDNIMRFFHVINHPIQVAV